MTPDPVDDIPEAEKVRELLAESIRRADLLKQLLKVARRKQSYARASRAPDRASSQHPHAGSASAAEQTNDHS